MSRCAVMELSFVIPAVGDQSQLDATLVSILENRSASHEILLVASADYHDPYQLDGEVRIVRHSRPAQKWPALANLGLSAASSHFLAVVHPGVEINSISAPLQRLKSQVALGSATPLLVAETDDDWALAGLDVTNGGACRQRRMRLEGRDVQAAVHTIGGPSRWLGVFRRSMLLELNGWDESMVAALADYELAARMQHFGWRSCCDCTTQVPVRAPLQTPFCGWRMGRDSERIFWRYLSGKPRVAALAAHLFEALVGRAARLAHAPAWGETLGRCLAVNAAPRQGAASTEFAQPAAKAA